MNVPSTLATARSTVPILRRGMRTIDGDSSHSSRDADDSDVFAGREGTLRFNRRVVLSAATAEPLYRATVILTWDKVGPIRWLPILIAFSAALE